MNNFLRQSIIFRNAANKLLFLFGIFILMDSSIFAKPAIAPEWMSNIRSVYPNSEFIAQKGSGKTADDAKADALSAIGRYFKTTVESNLKTSLKSVDGTDGFSETREVQDETKVSSNVDLLGVEFSEAYKSKAEKKFYCVAFINREYAWKQFRPKIEAEKASFYEFFAEAKKQSVEDPLMAARYFSKAKAQGEKFLEILEYGRTISEEREREYVDDRETLASIPKLQTDSALSATLFVEADDDYDEIISTKIRSVFSEAGFSFASQKSLALYIVRVKIAQNITVEDEGTPNALYTAQPALELAIENKISGKTTFSFSSRAAKKCMAYLRENVLKKAYSEFAENFGKELADEFRAAIFE